jgi:hypothetical protein
VNAPARYLSSAALRLREKLARLLAVRLKTMPEEERTRPVRVRLSKYCAEDLYEVGSQIAQEAWSGVQALEDEGLVRIQYGTGRIAKGAVEAWHRDPIVEAQAGSYEALAQIGGVALRNPVVLHLAAALLTSGVPEELSKLIATRAPAALLALHPQEALSRIEALSWKISRNGPARFRVNGPTLHGLPAEPRFESFTRPFSLRQVFEL